MMKRPLNGNIAPAIYFLLVILVAACGDRTAQKRSARQLRFSDAITQLLSDTASVNPLVDSLKKEILQSDDKKQLEMLGELAENWRPHSMELADEELRLAKQENLPQAEGDALCKKGICYCRKFNFDSCAYFLNAASTLADQHKLDGIKAQSLSWQAEAMRLSGDMNRAMEMQDKAIAIAAATGDKKRLAFCYISKGEAARLKSDFGLALECYAKAEAYAAKINDLNKISICYNSTGDVYRTQNNYPKALDYFNKGLDIAKRNRNKNQIAFCLSGMGDIYNAQKEYDKALSLYKEALSIASGLGLKLQECNSLSSIGMTYYLLDNKEEALGYFNKSIAVAEAIGNNDKIAFIATMMGDIYSAQSKKDEALRSYEKAIGIGKETGNRSQLEMSYAHLSHFYFTSGKLEEAKASAQKSLEFARQTETPESIKNAAKLLAGVYEKQNNYRDAYKMLDLFIAMRDTISNEESVKKFAAIEYAAKEAGLKAEQKAREQVFEAEQARKEEELRRQKTLRYAFTIGFALVLTLALVVYRGLRLNKKQNKIITAQKKEMEHQKELVEEKNKEIIDSITYAKRLQDAILPPLKMVKQQFPESFLYYKPKDIIAGDFYWMEHDAGKTFMAAADSTGHGVPGAMVSVVCSNALNRAIKEFRLNEPGKILDKTRELVLETFAKSEGDVKDGMDISLLCIDHANKKVSWSGANNPLWFIDDVATASITEIKANKQPIGKTDDPKPFVTHDLPYKTGTLFYLFTDGFPDQFGGPKGKKYKYKQLEELLARHCGLDMDEQRRHIEESFDSWKSHYEQVDDVTIIGLKL